MSICVACGNSIDNTTTCSRCGKTDLRALDSSIVAGAGSERDERSVDIDWDRAAEALFLNPSRESLREVKREARSRRRRLALRRLRFWR